MAKKKPLYGVNNYRGSTKKKRPGRQAKNPNKKFSRKLRTYIEHVLLQLVIGILQVTIQHMVVTELLTQLL